MKGSRLIPSNTADSFEKLLFFFVLFLMLVSGVQHSDSRLFFFFQILFHYYYVITEIPCYLVVSIVPSPLQLLFC